MRTIFRTLASYPVPAGLDSLLDQDIIQRDEPVNVIPCHGLERAEGQREQEDQREILHGLQAYPFLEQLKVDVAAVFFPQDSVSAHCHPVGGVVKLFQITKIKGILDEIAQQGCDEVEKPVPDGPI